MNTEKFKRKLTAILSADVEGYSRLMGEDEDATIRTLTSYRELMTTLIQKHRGRVVDSPGDNLLAEFLSVVDGVRCAVEIQEELRVRNAELPENRRMIFRIGINLGDVVEEGERIYGDGINIAARVEGLAEGGGICISGTVYDSIKNKLSLGYESMGEHTVKNIKEPVRVYRMRIGPDATALVVSKEKKPAVKRWQWAALTTVVVLIVGAAAVWNFYFRIPSIEPASVEKMAYSLPDKPSIAVLPFDNLSGAPDQDYLADGITENIIMALSNNPDMFVIARNSAFTYKGKAVKVQQVSEDLGVRYVLEGSIQKSGDRLRVNAQLIDALKGHHLWANRYDREMKALFIIQDEIAKEIAIALQVELTSGEQARVWHKTDSIEAWGYCTKASGYFRRFTSEGNAKAQELFAQAIKLDPRYAFAWTMLGWTHLMEVWLGYSSSPAESLKKAFEFGSKAAQIDQNHPEVHMLFCNLYATQKKFDQALAEGEKAIALGPNNAEDHYLFSRILRITGRPEEAIIMAQKAIRLHPYCPARYLGALATSYFMAGRYEEAVAKYEEFLKRDDKDTLWTFYAHLFMASACVRLEREEQAGKHAEEVLKLKPRISIESLRKSFSGGYKYPETFDPVLDDLKKAGIPEKPPTSSAQ
jgi:adenylate cyclase